MIDRSDTVIQVKQWLEKIVIGLEFCPFASKPFFEKEVRYLVSEAMDEKTLIDDIKSECELLVKTSENTIAEKGEHYIETTLVIAPFVLNNFYDFNFFLARANTLLKKNNWLGVFQLASFHPNYCFANANADDAENLTNRAPFPIIHILREKSVERALNFYPHADDIAYNNIQKLNAMSESDRRRLFSYLTTSRGQHDS